MAELKLDFFKGLEAYSDGESEKELLELFKQPDSAVRAAAALENPSWPLRYHLSPERANLLGWYDFKAGATLLEVGAGCGALTGVFCDKVSRVTAVELTSRRAEIVFNRHREKDNLTVYAGNINDIEFGEKFDYVTCIGVLEYAGRYTASPDPAGDFLRGLTKFLKPGGTLILAIENKFGLKYWAGVREDHTGRLFDSLEDYPNREGIRTYGRDELHALLRRSGLSRADFFYPMPDYKFPVELFSDEYLPSGTHNLRAGMFPFADHSSEREYIFNERRVMENIVDNNSFPFFANSFLVFAEF